MLAAIKNEIKDKTGYLRGDIVETIYFGGGTPSLLTAMEVEELLGALYKTFPIAPNPEITLEANPDDLTNEKIKELKRAGINRLSIGIQSFSPADLAFLNRAHNAAQAVACIEGAKNNGIDLLTIDLIYGIPGQEEDIWLANLDMITKFNIPHFSAYALTVEPKTQLDYLIGKKKIAAVNEDQCIRNFNTLMDWILQNNYLHYEISNFCRDNKFSKHNSAYWQHKKYVGFGPSAHSFNGDTRQWNIANNALYIKNIAEREPCFELEILTPSQKYNEYIMLSLRTCWGIAPEYIKQHFGAGYFDAFEIGIKQFLETNHVYEKNGHYILTNAGKLLADGIIAGLFVVNG